MNNNNNKRFIIAVVALVVTILLATSGWTFGIIKANTEEDLIRIEEKVDRLDDLLTQVVITQSVNMIEFKHLQEGMAQFQKELVELRREINYFTSK